MSAGKRAAEAARWLAQAVADLKAARAPHGEADGLCGSGPSSFSPGRCRHRYGARRHLTPAVQTPYDSEGGF